MRYSRLLEGKNKISDTLSDKIENLEQEEGDLSVSRIPVWVWYKDINQSQVNKTVERTTGLTEDKLSVNFDMPEPALLNNLLQEAPDGQKQMKEYLTQTAVARNLETQRTDKYIITRQEISRDMYIQKSENVINNFNINTKNIIFQSQYAPAFIANLSIEEIRKMEQKEDIEWLSLYTEDNPVDLSLASINISTNASKVRNRTGLTGAGVKVGQIEDGVPQSHTELNPARMHVIGTRNTTNHATGVARIMGGSNGIAPEIEIYSASVNNTFENIESMISAGVKVINRSNGGNRITSYTDLEKWQDHIAVQHSVTFVQAAGNDSVTTQQICYPGLSYNTITVGAYEDYNTDSTSDDRIASYSRYLNGDGCSKPDVMGPVANNPINGTSASTPAVTGVIALMLQLKPSLSYQPQVIKAILLASCQRKALCTPSETMEQGLTEKQGAGAVDAWNAVCIVAQGNYGYGKVTSATEKRNFVQSAYGASHMNVSIAWLRENTISSNNHASGTVTAGTLHDLDLRVYRNGTLVGSSANANSSTEMAYFPLSASKARYQIRVSKEDLTNLETVRYGYAWCTDKMAFRENLTGTDYPEGIYYIRNKSNANGAYLTVDEQTGQISQKAFTGEANQQWVSSKIGNLPFALQTSSSIYPGYLSKNGDEAGAVISKNIPDYIYFGSNGFDNTFGIQYQAQPLSNELSLTVQNGEAQNSPAVWRYQGVPDRFQWYFEPVGYKRGDVNRDGWISTADALLVQKYISKFLTLDAAQKFLGDMNNDGQVSLTDVTMIQKLISA